MGLAELLDFVLAKGCSPCEASRNRRFEFLIEAGVDSCGFECLDWSINIPGFGPELGIHGDEIGFDTATVTNAVLPEGHRSQDCGIAGFEERAGEHADAGDCGSRFFRLQVEK